MRVRSSRVSSARAVAGAFVCAAVVLATSVVSAQTSTGYATWAVEGSSASWTGTLDVASVAGGPSGSLTTNSLTPSVPTGASTFLGAGTPFGAVFGSSQSKPYLQARYTSGTQASTTVITFDSPTPTQRDTAGWGFALGDIDADKVTVTATTTGGASVSAAELGWQGAFNFCDTSPRPSGCTGGVYTDTPVWDPATSTLTGNGTDTSGAAGWFRPSVPLTTLTLAFTPLAGLPVFNLWVAAAGGTSLDGAVRCQLPDESQVPIEGVEVVLLNGTGSPVTVDGEAVTAITDADGAFTFDGLTPSNYTVSATYESVTLTESADTSTVGVVPDLLFTCEGPPPPPSTSTTLNPPTSTAPPTSAPPTTGPTPTAGPGAPTAHPPGLHTPTGSGNLPATGLAGLGVTVVGAASIASGAAIALATRRRSGPPAR